MYDGSIARFERVRFMDGAFTVAITPEKKILITRQEQPARSSSFVSLPGGAFDTPDEDPLECAKRELLEETGYMSDEWELWFTAEGTNNVIAYTYFYIAHECKKVADISADAGEKIELDEISFDEFLLLSEELHLVHWPLLPYLFGGRLHKDQYLSLQKKFRI